MMIFEQIGDNREYESITPTTATGFTAARYTPGTGDGFKAKAVQICPETAPIRVRMDGTAPTADEGIYVDSTEKYLIIGAENIANFQCIDTVLGASTVKCLFFF
jgi:hypothetical protein